jgi:hypothetical protein
MNGYKGQIMEFNYIDRNGIALDDYGNEFRDENGQIIIVPVEERAFYDIAYRPNEEADYD